MHVFALWPNRVVAGLTLPDASVRITAYMPELPDIVVYIDALDERVLGQTLERVRLGSPFLLRSVDPPVREAEGQAVVAVRRIGKRVAIGMANGVWLVLHLMIAGRLHWSKLDETKRAAKLPGKRVLAAFDFPNGTLTLTEAGSQRRASLHVVSGEEGLRTLRPPSLEVLDSDLAAFTRVLRSENHTLKRALTDPRLFSGIGNAYSDEILHRARLSPVVWTERLSDEQIAALYAATRATLREWIARLREGRGKEFPEKVTAFRPEMAVHGKYKQPCPVCGRPIQRIRYAANETNYCPTCQTGGRLLADRALSRLLGSDWPRTLEELELRMLG
jgi:formamidopyrimidine-DNA glycosylase